MATTPAKTPDPQPQTPTTVASDASTDAATVKTQAATDIATAEGGNVTGAVSDAEGQTDLDFKLAKTQAEKVVGEFKERAETVLAEVNKVRDLKNVFSQLSGHGGYLHDWETSIAGKAFIDVAEGEAQTTGDDYGQSTAPADTNTTSGTSSTEG